MHEVFHAEGHMRPSTFGKAIFLLMNHAMPEMFARIGNVFDWELKNDDWLDLNQVFAVDDSARTHISTMDYCNYVAYVERIMKIRHSRSYSKTPVCSGQKKIFSSQ